MNPMRITEIVDKNQTMIILNGMQTDFSQTFKMIKQAHNTFKSIGHVTKFSLLKEQIVEFDDELLSFINYDWPDKDDPDIIKMIENATRIHNELSKLE